MVSAEKYLKAFFSVMPERFKIIQKLKAEKAVIGKKIISGRELSSTEISYLIDIIGKDTFFRKAERRNKYTLRHINWKLLKSMKNLPKFSEMLLLRETDKQVKDKIQNLKQFLISVTPKVEDLLIKADRVYIKEVESLQLGDINTYKELIQEEQAISDKAKLFFIEIKKLNRTLINLLQLYYRYLKSKSELKVEIVNAVLILCFFGMAILFLYIGIDSLIGERSTWPLDPSIQRSKILIMFIFSSLLAFLGLAWFSRYSKWQNFIKDFVKKMMI